MFDILKVLEEHTSFLEKNLKKLDFNEKRTISLAFARFYFLLPNFEECVKQHFKIHISKEKLIDDLLNDNLQYLKDAIQEYDAEIDEYSEDYEELESMEINILSGLENCVYFDKSQNTIYNFLLIIDVLDYYEQFSDDREYWNKMLEEEIKFQQTIVEKSANGEVMDEDAYFERYKTTNFNEI